MQINGPTQLVFPDGASQQNLALTVSGASGAVQFSVTEVPSQVVSVRKTASSAPLAVGATLTEAEAAALVATRTAGSASYGPTVTAASVVGVKSRVWATGTTPPAFTVGGENEVNAVKNGNFWVPGYPTSGSGTLTVEILLDVGSAMTLGRFVDTLMSLGYGSATTDQWAGVTAKAIASADGSAVAILDPLAVTPQASEGNSRKKLNGTVTGAPSARWIGVRLEAAPPSSYPCVFTGLAVQAVTGAGGFTPLPSPVWFKVSATETAGAGSAITTASVVGVRSRVWATGGSAPAFTIGGETEVNAVKNGNFWVPNFPTSGSGTLTVELLLELASPVTLAQVTDTPFSLGYNSATTDQWAGTAAKALASADGAAVTVLNALTLTGHGAYPNSDKKVSGSVTGAPSGRFVGFRFETMAINYPLILEGVSMQAAGSGGATATHNVAIGDSSTDFGGTQPQPQPGGNPVVYGDPGTRFPLGLYVRDQAASYSLTVPSGLSLVEQVSTPTTVSAGSDYLTSNATGPFAPTQSSGGATSQSLQIFGTGKSHDGTYLTLSSGTYLQSGALGLSFPTSSDPAVNQAPQAMKLSFLGIIPAASVPLVAIYQWATGGMSLWSYWQANKVFVRIERNGSTHDIYSDAVYSNTALEDISVRYADTPGGTGTVTFYRAGVQVGTAKPTNFKLRIPPGAPLECNVLGSNTSNSGTLKIRKIGLIVDLPSTAVSYSPVGSGTISAARLQALFVDALSVSSPQAAKTLTYQPSGGTIQSVDVVIGPMAVAAGAAYRAVLEDWSSGSAVSHPNVLVMTKPSRQLCRFEDADLYDSQAPWTECLPQGPVPVIGSIAYYCEAIRSGSYVQFQFGYDWTAAAMPNNPFGDPTGKESYMVPHKWRIEDSSGNLIAKIERPDGGPLNGTDIPRVFSNSSSMYDGNGAPMTSSTAKWYPRGTVRSAVVWRSAPPPAYSQATINARLPRYDVTVPYARHTHYSTNGGDLRITFRDQLNGFGNTRVIPWLPTNRAALITQAGVTQDPYKASLYNSNSLAAVASTWLKYTPFNAAGRDPMTGPGGIRDDRAAIAEPVAQYMYDVTAKRPHDQVPFSSIALDYLTSYASDPYHCFEGGRCVPLYKGGKASRVITLRNHYYGAGEASTPPERAYYIEGGQAWQIAPVSQDGTTRTFTKVSPDKPIFGTHQIDSSHAHQYPYWGSLLWQTPEFAFLGHKMWDQTRLYENLILAGEDATRWAHRAGAWSYLHAALAWKTASANSDRLYTRSEVLAFVKADFEAFSDRHKTSSPGFDNPPANVFTNGAIDQKKVIYAATNLFGIGFPVANGFGQHDFYHGYWLSALGIAEKLGFNAALRAASPKAAAVLDWMIGRHRRRIVGRINEAPRVDLNADGYTLTIWTTSAINAASGNVASLPQTYAAVAAQNGNAPSWDTLVASNGSTESRDSESLDQIIAGPSILKNQLGQTGADLDTALSTAAGWRNQKKSEQGALGINAGSTWFTRLHAVNNPAIG